MSKEFRILSAGALAFAFASTLGCAHLGEGGLLGHSTTRCDSRCDQPCDDGIGCSCDDAGAPCCDGGGACGCDGSGCGCGSGGCNCGCHHGGICGCGAGGACGRAGCGSHSNARGAAGCGSGCRTCGNDCSSCNGGRVGLRGRLAGMFCGRRSHAIPETLPLGSTVRAHYQVMETNGEAADFIFHRHDFVGQTAQLTPDGRDKILEVAVRMKSAPFPVLVERSENNSDPELDLVRRNLVAQILTEFGVPDADCRTVVSPSYGRGYNGIEAESTYYRHLLQGGGFNNGYGGFGGYGNGLFGGAGLGGGLGINGFAGGGIGGRFGGGGF